MSGYAVIDSGTDDLGQRWEVGRLGTALCAGTFGEPARLRLSGAQRDRFAEAVARAVMPGTVPSAPVAPFVPLMEDPSLEHQITLRVIGMNIAPGCNCLRRPIETRPVWDSGEAVARWKKYHEEKGADGG